jgi:hypothetical protein
MDVLLIYALECELQSSVSRMQSTNLGVLLVLFCLTSGQIAGISGAIGGAVTGGLSTGRPFGALAGAAFGGLSNYASYKLGDDENKNIGTGIGSLAGGLGNLKRGSTGAGVLGRFVGVGSALAGSSGSAAIGGDFDSTSRTKTIGGNMLKGTRSGFLGGAAQDVTSQLMKDFLKCRKIRSLCVKHKILSLCSLGIVVILDVLLIDYLAESAYSEMISASDFISFITIFLLLLTMIPSYLYMQWAFERR